MANWTASRALIRALIERVLGEASIAEPPVPVERIARMHGLRLRFVPFEGELSGLIAPEGEYVVIGVNALHPAARQRFTLAHELGHYFLHQHDRLFVDRNFQAMRRDERSSKGVDVREIEANEFAAELLMPSRMLERDVDGAALDLVDDETIRALAERYRVSLQAMVFRLTNLGVLSAAGTAATESRPDSGEVLDSEY
jgi:Zn-dependent peptidase ImmA (M78 family)